MDEEWVPALGLRMTSLNACLLGGGKEKEVRLSHSLPN